MLNRKNLWTTSIAISSPPVYPQHRRPTHHTTLDHLGSARSRKGRNSSTMLYRDDNSNIISPLNHSLTHPPTSASCLIYSRPLSGHRHGAPRIAFHMSRPLSHVTALRGREERIRFDSTLAGLNYKRECGSNTFLAMKCSGAC